VKNKLLNKALITSPIISIYGVAPIFLFNSLGLEQIIISFISLTIMIFLFWLFNIYLVNRNVRATLKYFASYTGTFLLHSGIVISLLKFPEKQNPETFLIYLLVTTIALNTIILVIINTELLKIKKDIAETEIQLLKVGNLEAQKQVLLQQLHPHFLFNALSTLKSLIKDNSEQASDYLVKLSEFLRYSVQAHSNELVTLEEEMQFTNDYIELQKVRFGNAFQCSIDIPSAILQLKLPVFALQTLVENAIKHNTFTEKKPLNINMEFIDNRLKISNNKLPKPLIQKSGTGIKNLNERYLIVSGKALEIINNDNEFIVYLNLLEK